MRTGPTPPRRAGINPGKYAGLSAKTPAEIFKDLQGKFDNFQADSRAAEMAYCDTAYEHFHGSFDDFQSHRDDNAADSLDVFQSAMDKAVRNPAVVALIRAAGGDLADWLPEPAIKPQPTQRRPVARINHAPAP